MTAAYDWFRTIAASLNDDKPGAPFRRYALKDLIAYYNDALCLISKHRPDLFAEIKVAPLTCGTLQDLRGCCGNVTDVIAQTDAHGNTIKDLTANKTTTTKVRSKWNKPSCLSAAAVNPTTGQPAGYVIETVSIDLRLNGRFTVYPPVPPGVQAYVMVKCQGAPCTMTEADVLGGKAVFAPDCGYLAIVRFFVLGMALSGDRHSNAAQSEANRFFRMFFDLLGIAQQQEDRAEREAG